MERRRVYITIGEWQNKLDWKLLLPLIAIFISCTSDSIYQRIDFKMQNNDTESAIYMKDIITEKWDTMYVLDYNDPIKFPKYQNGRGDERRIIFVCKSKIVYQEVERAKAIGDTYKVTFRSSSMCYTPETALFNVVKDEWMGGEWYYLTPINTTNNN